MDVDRAPAPFVFFVPVSWSLWNRTSASWEGELMLNSVPLAA